MNSRDGPYNVSAIRVNVNLETEKASPKPKRFQERKCFNVESIQIWSIREIWVCIRITGIKSSRHLIGTGGRVCTTLNIVLESISRQLVKFRNLIACACDWHSNLNHDYTSTQLESKRTPSNLWSLYRCVICNTTEFIIQMLQLSKKSLEYTKQKISIQFPLRNIDKNAIAIGIITHSVDVCVPISQNFTQQRSVVTSFVLKGVHEGSSTL